VTAGVGEVRNIHRAPPRATFLRNFSTSRLVAAAGPSFTARPSGYLVSILSEGDPMPDNQPDDHRQLFAAERDELAKEEHREDRAVRRADEAHEEYEEEEHAKTGPGKPGSAASGGDRTS
jgi:hypothetical protein